VAVGQIHKKASLLINSNDRDILAQIPGCVNENGVWHLQRPSEYS
jgi:hypothetical protein